MKIQPDTYLTALGYAPMPKKLEMVGWKQEPITDKQKSQLEKYGVAYARIAYKGQASMLLSIIYDRQNKRMATPKQIQMLLEKGYCSGHIKRLTVDGASKIIAKLIVI